MYKTETELNVRVIEHASEAIRLLGKEGLQIGRDYFYECTTLQGSQNYGTQHENSDVDTKMVITPSYKSLLKGVKFNQTLILENGEHCDVRTAQDMINNICKGNINWIEGLYTTYSDHNEGTWWADMCNLRDDIVGAHRLKIMSAVYGMAQQKKASLFKPTVTTKPYFDKHGFDNKNFIHIVRLHDFEKQFMETQDFAHSMDFSTRGAAFMERVREGGFGIDEAVSTVEALMESMNFMYHQVQHVWEKPDVDFQQRLEDRYVEWVV